MSDARDMRKAYALAELSIRPDEDWVWARGYLERLGDEDLLGELDFIREHLEDLCARLRAGAVAHGAPQHAELQRDRAAIDDHRHLEGEG